MALRILPFLSGLAVLGGFFLNPLSSAHAQQLDALSIGKWTITPYFGATVLNNQTMVEAATLSASGSITFSDGSILSATAAATLNETDFSDFYDTPLVFGADVGYMQTERLEDSVTPLLREIALQTWDQSPPLLTLLIHQELRPLLQ